MQITSNAVMGSCVSLGHLQRQKSNFFHVWNVDEYGDVLAPGNIEITDNCLVLHQKTSREAVVWPIKCLRRYGFDAELFSFESGRRCTTGPGVYAFKCHRAQSLFNILQQKILQDDSSAQTGSIAGTIPPPPPPLTTLLPISTQSAERQTPSNPSNDTDNYLEPIVINRSNSVSSQPPIFGNVREGGDLNAVRTSIEHLMRQLSSSSEPQPELSSSLTVKAVTRGQSLDDETNYAKLDDLLKQEHLYMNVAVSNTTSNLDEISRNDWTDAFSCGHCYANVAPAGSSSKAGKAACSKMKHSKSMVNCPRQVTYAILDLKKRSSNNNSLKMQSAQLENTLCVTQAEAAATVVRGYAKIDFDKTTALSNVNQTQSDDDQSVRKTRHNSNAVSSMSSKRTSLANVE